MQSVETAGEEAYNQYSSNVTISKNELIGKLKEKHPDIQIDYNHPDAIKILEYTDGGRVRTIKIGNYREFKEMEKIYALGLEELIQLKWLDYPKQSTDLM